MNNLEHKEDKIFSLAKAEGKKIRYRMTFIYQSAEDIPSMVLDFTSASDALEFILSSVYDHCWNLGFDSVFVKDIKTGEVVYSSNKFDGEECDVS